MNIDVLRWQEDAKNAFAWVASMYDQAQTLWEDAERYFAEANWTPKSSGGLGGAAMAQFDLSQWPFIYLKALVAVPQDEDETTAGLLPMFGLLFHDEARVGPVVFAGTVRWSGKAAGDHWALYAALTGYKDRFHSVPGGGGPIRATRPTPAGSKRFPGVEEVRWLEIPLGAIATPKSLKSIVAAAIEMAQGNDADMLALVPDLATVTTKSPSQG